jgi:hypothetical protein
MIASPILPFSQRRWLEKKISSSETQKIEKKQVSSDKEKKVDADRKHRTKPKDSAEQPIRINTTNAL